MDEMKRIRIGNQTAFAASTLMLPFEYAVANGFNAFEWFPDRHESGEGWDVSDIDAGTRSYIKDRATTHDIALSVHASLQANPLKNENLELWFKDIEFAQDIGASLFNIHLYTDGGIETYIKAITPIIRRSAEAGIKLAIENTPLTIPDDFNKIFALFQNMPAVDTAHTGICLDPGHANLCGSTRNDYLGFIDRLDTRVPVIHIHMHENYGDKDSHLTIFSGPAGENTAGVRGFIERMKKRRFSGSVILEQWPDPPSLLNRARDRLYNMWMQDQEYKRN
ncbi:endonuclease 4 [bacterium BMS3Bbin05]|nr:endonuclease 4 [bacterium BMS3Bbin05]HDH05856.1 sugar phosphate isomerase/epimerase [Nitrospirota bacterium]